MAARKPKGVYCLEIGEWFETLTERHSVEPILQLLLQSPAEVPYIHRDIATATELEFYIRKWVQRKHHDYPILYLGFHGRPGIIQINNEVGEKIDYNLPKLFALLAGKCRRRVIHFGSCDVLKLHGNTARAYLKQSGAVAISGYASSIDWVHSSVFDMLYLSLLQGNAFTASGLRAVKKKLMTLAPALAEALEFRMRIRK